MGKFNSAANAWLRTNGTGNASPPQGGGGGQGSTAALFAQRRKPKDLPAVTTEQRAAPLRVAVGLAREGLLLAARINNDGDDAESNADLQPEMEDDEIADRAEEERRHQELP